MTEKSGRWCAGAAILAAGLTAGCYPKVGAAPPPLSQAGVDRAVARWPGAASASLAAGREKFLSACNQCHGYPDLASFSEDRWPGIMNSMAKKANLDAGAKESVLHFILAARAERAAP